jgi:hypothetical protein
MRDYGTQMEDNLTAHIAFQADILTSEIASQTDSQVRSLRDLISNQFAKRSMCNSVAERTLSIIINNLSIFLFLKFQALEISRFF